MWDWRMEKPAAFTSGSRADRANALLNQLWIWSFMRKLVPSMITVWTWWRRRSSMAVVMVLSLLKMLGHCLKGLLVVSRMEPRS